MASLAYQDDSDPEYESSASDSDSEIDREPILASSPKTAPPASRKMIRPFLSERRAGVRPSKPSRPVLPYTKRTKSVLNETPRRKDVSNRFSSSHVSGESSAVLSALGELTSTLNKVVKRLEKTEHRIQSMEEKVESSLSSASDSHSKTVRKVPVIVRVSAVISCGSD